MFRNMKIGVKIFTGYVVALLFTVILGILALTGMSTIRAEIQEIYDRPYTAVDKAQEVRAIMQETQKNYALALMAGSADAAKPYLQDGTHSAEIKEIMEGLRALYPEYDALFNQFEQDIEGIDSTAGEIAAAINAGDSAGGAALITQTFAPAFDKAHTTLMELVDSSHTEAEKAIERATQIVGTNMIVVVTALGVAIVLCVLIGLTISRAIRKPAEKISEAVREISQGHLDIHVDYESKDAMGVIVKDLDSAAHTLKAYISEISHMLSEIADGNLTVSRKEEYLGDFVLIGKSLDGIVDSFGQTFRSIDQSADMVSAGASDVASGAQALAQGATEQSATIQQLSASISDVATNIQTNAKNTEDVNRIIQETGLAVNGCNEQMSAMLVSMQEINTGADEIAKIIKVIDDISFQTNILALNAAVEAARAGEAGKGFAVVADEVRNLANKSAQAAAETTTLIEGAQEKVAAGSRIANDTAEALQRVVDNAGKISGFMEDIARASDDQAQSVATVNEGVEQITVVVQNNSATAQQSAAASEELSGQASLLKEMLNKFRLNDEEQHTAPIMPHASEKSAGSSIVFPGDDKY